MIFRSSLKVKVLGHRARSPDQKYFSGVGISREMLLRSCKSLMTSSLVEMPRKRLRNMTVQIQRRVFSKHM